jgi:hypothetical protein
MSIGAAVAQLLRYNTFCPVASWYARPPRRLLHVAWGLSQKFWGGEGSRCPWEDERQSREAQLRTLLHRVGAMDVLAVPAQLLLPQ